MSKLYTVIRFVRPLCIYLVRYSNIISFFLSLLLLLLFLRWIANNIYLKSFFISFLSFFLFPFFFFFPFFIIRRIKPYFLLHSIFKKRTGQTFSPEIHITNGFIRPLDDYIVLNCTKNLPWNTLRILNFSYLVVFLHDQKVLRKQRVSPSQASSTAFFFFLENFYFYSKSSSALNPPSLPTYILSTLRKNAFHPWFRTALLLRLICTCINLKHLGCESGFRSVSFD